MDNQELLVQAQAAVQAQKIDLAKSIYDSILENDSKNFVANTNLGILNIKSSNINKGLECLKAALDNHRKRPDAWINYIKYLMLSERNKNASEVIIEGKKYGLKGDIIDQYEILCFLGSNPTLPSENKKLISFFLRGRFQEILDLESSLDSSFFEESSYHYLVGFCLLNIGSYKNAINRFKKSIELKSDLVDSYRLLIGLLSMLSDKTDIKKYQKEYLILKSKTIKTESNLLNTIDIHLDKLELQGGIPTFFDNCVSSHIKGLNNEQVDYCKLFEYSNNSKNNRFISYSERVIATKNRRQVKGLPFVLSQGTHSLIKWKDYELYKTTNDLALYSMILNEVKPDIIIELGTGSGGSAVWMSDICKSLGFDNHIFSYDIKKPHFEYDGITFIEFDINTLEINNGFPLIKSFDDKRILFIEDAHVNILSVLNTINKFLSNGDYLIVEDSSNKQKEIHKFMQDKSDRYKVDQFYLDFFGMNMSCSIDSIFRVFN